MTYKIYPEQDIEDIAKAIRSRNGLSKKYTVSEMADAINNFDIYSLVGEDNAPYLYRQAPNLSSDYDREHDTIIGGTVAWNQIATFSQGSGTSNGITFTRNSDGTIVASGTATATAVQYLTQFNATAGHKYLFDSGTNDSEAVITLTNSASWGGSAPIGISGIGNCVASGASSPALVVYSGTTLTNKKFVPQVFDLTQMFGSTISDYIYSLEQANEGVGVAWFKKLFSNDYYEYNAGELKSVEGLESHDMVGKNKLNLTSITPKKDENGITFTVNADGTIKANGTATARAQIYWDIPKAIAQTFGGMILNGCVSQTGASLILEEAGAPYTSYAEDTGSGATISASIASMPTDNAHLIFRVTNGTTLSNVTIKPMIRLSSVSDATYEPYIKHSYPLDNSLTLRGILKLDSANNLYYDGDVYNSDGSVIRKYGVVDLGSLNWTYVASWGSYGSAFYTGNIRELLKKPTSDAYAANCICTEYANMSRTALYTLNGKGLAINTNGDINVRETAYTDAATFKTAMNGVMLVYEKATPTTEEAELFSAIQICDPNGTEEYVTTGIPVGHETKYLEVVEI